MPSQAPRQIKTIVGSNVRAARKERGLTQSQFAARLGIEPMNVSRWERGKVMPSMESLVALARGLDCEIEWLCTDHDDEDVAA